MDDIAGFIVARLDEREHFAKIARLPKKHREQELREVAALRRIVDLYNSLDSVPVTEADLCYANGQASGVSAVASIWADHPDYRPEWAL